MADPKTEKGKVSLKTAFLYNGAGFSFNLYDTVLYAWLPFVYTPPEGSGRIAFLPLAVFGAILAGGRLLDAFSDPLIGYWSDRTESRWGRRKPFLFVSGPILFITFLLVWRPPVAGMSNWNGLFLGVVLFFYYWAYTGMLIPWMGNLPEITRNGAERIKIVSLGIVIGTIGALIGGGLSGGLLEWGGPFRMALILGAVSFLFGQLSLFGIRDNHPPPAEEIRDRGFFRTMAEVFKDRQVLSFSAMILFVQMTYQLMLMNVPYLTTQILGRDESESSILMGAVIILMAAATPLWYYLLGRYPKRRIMKLIIILMAAGFTAAYFVQTYTAALIILPLAAIPMGGMFTAALSLLADLADYGELKNGTRNEAVYYGIYGIVRKSGWAACSLILAFVFETFGYSTADPTGIRIIWIVCAASCLLGLALFLGYRVGDSREETAEILGLEKDQVAPTFTFVGDGES